LKDGQCNCEAGSMNDNINIDSTITVSMNDNINMDSTTAVSMNDNINNFVHLPKQDLDFQHLFHFCIQCVKMRGDCWFCWYWWNCWLSLFKLSFHTKHCSENQNGQNFVLILQEEANRHNNVAEFICLCAKMDIFDARCDEKSISSKTYKR
jgi:hypothetical protein